MAAINTRQYKETDTGNVSLELLLTLAFFGLADALAYSHGFVHTVAFDLQLMEGGLHKQQIGQVSLLFISHRFSIVYLIHMRCHVRRSSFDCPPSTEFCLGIVVAPHVLSVT